MTTATLDSIRRYLTAEQANMETLLAEVVSMESPSNVPESQGPLLDRLADELRGLNYEVRRIPGRATGGHLFARPSTRERPTLSQLLVGHCDTVWPIGTLEDMPVLKDNGMLHGPGVYDMKAGLVEMLFALRAIRELDCKPHVMPMVFINSDEEIGSRESTPYIVKLARLADRALILEPSLGITGKLKTARKGVGRFTVTVRGKAAHAGLDPTAGASAILELSHVIQALFALNDPQQGTSVNVGVIDGGVRPNVVAPESTAVVDVRVETRALAGQVEEAILGLKPETPGVSLHIEGHIGRPPMEHTPANQQLWTVATNLAQSMQLPLEQGTAGGASDGNTTSQFTATLDGLGAVGNGAHAANEFVYLDQLPERCTLLSMLLLEPPLRTGRT
jgi:glutamate carboxypeptidase